MLRTIGGVAGGYVTMALFVFVLFSIAYLAMGAEGAFKSGSYEVTALWLIVSFVLSLLAAIAGGFVCAVIARNPKGPLALAGLVVVLGLLLAIPVLRASSSDAKLRPAQVGNLEAMQNARQPKWVALLNPLIGAAGVMLGARLKNKAKQSAQS